MLNGKLDSVSSYNPGDFFDLANNNNGRSLRKALNDLFASS